MPAPDALPADDIARLKRTASAARDVADAAIERLREVLPLSKNPHAISVGLGVATEKAILLTSLIQGIEDREVRLNTAAGEQIAALLGVFLEAVGIPATPAVRAALRELLAQAGRGGVLSVSPSLAQPAFSEVRERFADELRSETMRELQEQHRGLPAPQTGADPHHGVEQAPPHRGEQEPDAEPGFDVDEQIPNAELVEEPPDPAHPAIGRVPIGSWSRPSPGNSRQALDRFGMLGPDSTMRPPGGAV